MSLAAAVSFRTPLHGLWSVCGSSAEDREHLGCLGSYARRDDLTCVPVRDSEVEMDEQLASVPERRVSGVADEVWGGSSQTRANSAASTSWTTGPSAIAASSGAVRSGQSSTGSRLIALALSSALGRVYSRVVSSRA